MIQIAARKQTVSGAGLDLKFERLNSILRERLTDGLIVAFSGGVDSALLLWAAEQERKRSGGELLALTTASESLSAAERKDVESFVAAHNIEHVWRDSRELLDEKYLANDSSRCFHCKSELFRICAEVAAGRGLRTVAYGYNASDRGDVRPGHQAALDHNVIAPLADADLTKDDIRESMRMNGLEMSEKPASPCLSSRIMTGVPITGPKLKIVEDLEAVLRLHGLRVFRVRLHESNGAQLARLEVAPDEMEAAFLLRDVLTAEAKRHGVRWITIDLAGYMTGGGNASAA
ncbi:MAG TPA: hypothetical protein VGO43_00430 [Pyrinomonadaceae bacterium]|jgi:uncharacterized protein|nr:hypothetical protein [Pyrinomonadaceae bacterium]